MQLWDGVIGFEGVETVDRRSIVMGALTWPRLPLTLYRPRRDDLSENVGEIVSVLRLGAQIRASGLWAAEQLEAGTELLVGIDVFIEKSRTAYVNGSERIIISAGELRGAAIIATSAWPEAKIVIK